jgi:TonB-dependent receptor
MLVRHGAGVAMVVAAAVAVLAVAPPVQAQEQGRQDRKTFDIDAGPAADAVAAFARQAQVNVLASGEQLAGRRTGAVKGPHSVAAALTQLLAGSGLAAKTMPSGAIFITPVAPMPAAVPPAASAAGAAAPSRAPPAGRHDVAHAAPVVVIAGTRLAIASAIDLKKNAATVTDSIVAEDVGQFPDKNVGEALSRMTGVQISSDFGEGNQISIRGVQPDLNRIEINGASVLSTADGTRAPDLRELPSELIKSIEVVKGVTADLTEGGIGGTVLIRTNRPLDFKKFTFASTVAAEQNSLRGGVQPRASLLIADQFFGRRLGLMANLVHDKVLTQADRVRNSGWRFLRDWDFSPEKTVPSLNPAAAAVFDRTGCTALAGVDRTDCERQWYDYSPSNPRYGILRRDHARTTAELTAQVRFSDAWSGHASFQRFRQASRLHDLNYATDLTFADRLAGAGALPTYDPSGVPSGGACVAPTSTATPAGMVVANHHVTQYVVGDCLSVAGRGGSNAFSIEARDFIQRVDNYYRTAGVTWRQDGWEVDAMLTGADGHYRNDSNYLGLLMNAPGLTVNLDDRGFPHFTFPANGGPDNLAAYTQVQFTYNPVEIDNAEDQLRLDVRYRPQWLQLPAIDRVAFGVQGRRQATQRYANGGYVLDAGSDLVGAGDDLAVQSPNVRYTWNYDPQNSTGVLRAPTVQSFVDANNDERWVNAAQMQALVGAVRGTSPDFLGGAGLAGFPSNWASANYGAAAPFFDTSAFTHDRLRQAPGSDGAIHPQIPTYHVEERTRAAYVRADYSTELWGHALAGNLGLRYAGTRTRSLGRQRLFVRTERAAGSATYDDRLLATAIVARENRYHDFLPSVNAVLWLRPETLLLRAGYGKVLARPSLERLSPNITCTINSGKLQYGGNGVDKCTAGNPGLQPYRAASTDVSLEWYPGQGNQVSLAYFRKDIDTAIRTGAVVRTDLLQDGTMFDVTTTVNTRGATTKGVEFAVRTAFSFLPAPFDGFGVDANFTRMGYAYAPGTALVNPLDGSELPFPGMSRTARNLALWYERGPLNARIVYNRRSGYYTGSNDTNSGNPLFVEPAGFLDLKLQWHLTARVSVAFEAKNLTDAHTLTTAGAITRPNEYSWSGRRYFVSAGYAF